MTLWGCDTCWAQTSVESLGERGSDVTLSEPVPPTAAASTEPETGQASRGLVSDIKLYFTAPLRWDAQEWAWFGGALAAIGIAHHYDTQVRNHFVKTLAPGQTVNADDVRDVIPTVVVLTGTWAYVKLRASASPARAPNNRCMSGSET